jgi:predicted GIY-YIG superfamily endonuclease
MSTKTMSIGALQTNTVLSGSCGTKTHEDINEEIKREKQLKKWRRKWKLELIEEMNPYWNDLYDTL